MSVVTPDGFTTADRDGDALRLERFDDGVLVSVARARTGSVSSMSLSGRRIREAAEWLLVQAEAIEAATVGPKVETVPCDGRALRAADYPELAAALGLKYGAAEPGTFRVPALNGRDEIVTRSLSARPGECVGDIIGWWPHV